MKNIRVFLSENFQETVHMIRMTSICIFGLCSKTRFNASSPNVFHDKRYMQQANVFCILCALANKIQNKFNELSSMISHKITMNVRFF